MTLPMDVKDYKPRSQVGKKIGIVAGIAAALFAGYVVISNLTKNISSAEVKSWKPYFVQAGDRCWNLVGNSYGDGEIRQDLVYQLMEKNPRIDCGNLKPGDLMYIPDKTVPVNALGQELSDKL